MARPEQHPPVPNNSEPWISLVEVVPLPGNDALGDAKGAYVNVVALAADRSAYIGLVESTMANLQFRTLHYADVMPFYDWQKLHTPSAALVELADALSPEDPIQFGEFHAYDSDDA